MRGSRGLALAALAGGGLLVVGNALLFADPDARGLASGPDYPTVAVVVVGALLVTVGLVGVHLTQRTSYGRLGLVAFLLTIGSVLPYYFRRRWPFWSFVVSAVFLTLLVLGDWALDGRAVGGCVGVI